MEKIVVHSLYKQFYINLISDIPPFNAVTRNQWSNELDIHFQELNSQFIQSKHLQTFPPEKRPILHRKVLFEHCNHFQVLIIWIILLFFQMDNSSQSVQDIQLDDEIEFSEPLEEESNAVDPYYIKSTNIPQESLEVRKDSPQRTFEMTVQTLSSITAYYESIQYTICSKLGQNPSRATRTFSHFQWLHLALKNSHIGVVVPAVPTKSIIIKLNINEQTQIQRDKRFYQLRRFLEKIVSHPVLSKSQFVDTFFCGSLENIQNELSKMDQYKSFASQMGSLIYTRGSQAMDLAKGTIRFLSSFISTPPPQTPSQIGIIPDLVLNEEVNTFFFGSEELLSKEEDRIKRLLKIYVEVTQCRVEQIEDLKKASQKFKLIGMNTLYEKLERDIYIESEILQKIRTDVLYKLEMSLADIQEALNVVRARFELINEIRLLIKAYNDPEQRASQSLGLEQVQGEKKRLSHLEQQFASDFELFARRLNDEVSKLILEYNELHTQKCQELSQMWTE